MKQVLPAALMATITLASPASADVVNFIWSDSANFVYEISHMPDFDQKRDGSIHEGGLPGGGRFHCIPSAIMNLFAYAANHGFAELDPGDKAWYLQEHYVEASFNINQLGVLMDTDPEEGTGYSDAVDGAIDWLDENGGGKFIFEHASRTDTWAPKINNLAERGIFGGIVAFCYGRYDVQSSAEGFVIVGERTSGHCVTLVRAARGGDAMVIESRDPSGGGSTYTQSGWANKVYDTEMVEMLSPSPFRQYQMTSLDFEVGDSQVRLIDTMWSIRPKASYSWASSNRITINVPWTLDPAFPNLAEILVNLPQGSIIVDASELLGSGRIAVAAELTSGTLGVASLMDGSFTSLASVPNGARIIAGRHGSVYVLCGEQIECYDPELEDPLVGWLALDHVSSDIAYDDATDTVVVWSSEESVISLVPHTLGSLTTYTLNNLPQNPDGHVTVGRDGTIWLTVGQPNNRIYAVTIPAGGAPDVSAISHPELIGITDFDVDDDGRVFACVNGIVKEFMPNPDTGGWMPATDSPSGLNGTECAGQISVRRGRSNFDPATMSGPGWVNSDAELVVEGVSIPDCPGDIDGNQVVEFADLLAVLAAWGACPVDCDADIDENGTVDFQEILTVLAHWGPCS